MFTIGQEVIAFQKTATVIATKLGRTGKQNGITLRFSDGTEIKTHPAMATALPEFEPPLTGEAAYENLRQIVILGRQMLKNPLKVW